MATEAKPKIEAVLTIDPAFLGDKFKFLNTGKVREIFECQCTVPDKGYKGTALLFIATDRLSCYDVVMKTGIPGKGKVLTQITSFWLDQLKDLIPNHLLEDNVDKFFDVDGNALLNEEQKAVLRGRSMLVRKLSMLPVESIARGYITGSGWKDYNRTKKEGKPSVCGIPLKDDLKHCQKLEPPLYTPSTKAEYGEHDENISQEEAKKLIGEEVAEKAGKLCLALYSKARDVAAERGIILADTKFEFGLNEAGEITLADEVLTPDSSRYWPRETHDKLWAEASKDGGEQIKSMPSYDKQFVRDWLADNDYDKKTPWAIPEEVTAKTVEKYAEIFKILTGKDMVF